MAAEVILRVKVDRSQYNAFKAEVKKGITPGTDGVSKSLKETGDAAQTATTKIQSLGEMLTKKIAWYSISMAITSVTTAFKDALNEIKEVDKQLTNISKVSGKSMEELQGLADKAYSTASKYGVQASKYMEAVYEYTKAGFKDNADAMGELSTKAMLVGDTTASVADKFLIAANAAWKYNENLEALTLLVDKADYINNNYATTFEKIADGFPRVASVASMAGMTAEETMAALGTITATTQETASRAGTALRALILNILGDTTTEVEDGVTNTKEEIDSLRKILEEYATDVVKAADATGKLINPMEALQALSEAYNKGNLTDRALFQIEKSLGGKLRTNQLDALLKNFDKYQEMLTGMTGAAGTADKEIDTMLTSWDAKSQILKNTWTEFVSKGLNADVFKKVIDRLTDIIDRFEGLNEILPIVAGAMTALFAPALFGNIEKASANISNLSNALRMGFKTVNEETGAVTTNFTAIGTAVSLAATAITVVYTAYQNFMRKVRQDAEERADEALEASNAAGTEIDNIVNLYTEREKAKKALDEGTGSVEKYTEATKLLCAALGEESFAIESVEDSLDSLADTKIEEKIKEQETAINDAAAAVEQWAGTISGRGGNDILSKLTEMERVTYYTADGQAYYTADIKKPLEERLQSAVLAYRSYYSELNSIKAAYGADSYGAIQSKYLSGEITSAEARNAEIFRTTWTEDAMRNRRAVLENYLSEAEIVGKYVAAIDAKQHYEDVLAKYKEEAASLAEVESAADAATEAQNDYDAAVAEAADEAEKAAEAQKRLADAFSEVMGNANSATEALEKYNAAIEADQAQENADALVEAASNAFDAAEKGLVDSAEVQGFADLWFSTDQIIKFKKEGINMADALMNDPNFRRLFIAGVDDEGKTIFREGIDSAKEFVDMIKEADDNFDNILEVQDENGIWGVAAHLEETDQGLRVVVDDWALLAKQFNTTEAAVKMLMNAYGQLIPGLEASTGELLDFADAAGALYTTFNGIKQVDLAKVISEAFAQGASTEQVWDLVQGLKEAQENGDIQLVVGDQEVQDADEQTQELIEKLNTAEDPHYVHVNSYEAWVAANRLETIRSIAEQLNGRVYSFGMNLWQTVTGQKAAEGTDSAPGGATLVNEEGPELILEKGRARIAGGGHPTITNLQKGAKVWTAKETKAILGNAKLDELYDGIHAYASGTNATVAGISRTTNASWATYMNWINNPVDTDSLKYYKAVVSLRKSELELLENSGASISSQVTKQKEIQNSIIEEIKYLQKVGGSQEDINELAAEWYSIQNKITEMTAPKIIAASELYSNLQKSINKQISDLQDKRDAELKSIDKQIEALQKAHDVQAQTNELKEKELAVTKAQQELDNAKAQRTVRVWNATKGMWEWTYNASNVKSATENLTSAKQALTDYKNEQAYQKKIDDLEAQQTTITQKYNTQIEKWQKVLDSIEEPVKSISTSMKELLKYTTSEMSPTVTRIKQAFAKNGLTFDSGGVLRGLGGIKATSADEVILPPDVTKKMLSPVSSKMFSQRLNELRYIYGATGNLAGYTNNAIGSQHNGDIYTFGNVTLSTEQAKNTTVYDLVRMARGLRSYASAI